MLRITCPYCGPRDELEFRCGGEAHIVRPGPPETVSDEDWGAYLFQRQNPVGAHHERWVHEGGCRQWFHLVRDTRTHEVIAVYKMDEPKPEVPE
ncbi:MAG: sarcosine oxidase subunit delta [Henriciella sp.]|nr:sarcosine oxidase subunit delta [Henriciella sp.]